jgi:FtsZ-binding cell division protein ZapB
MEQLDDLMDKLNSDKFCAVTVYDRDTSKPIFRNVTHEQIKNDYGTAEEFFEKVFAEGYKKLTLQEKRKNGANAFKIEGDTFDVSFGSTAEVQPKQSAKKKKKKKMKSGLMGLGMTEIFDLKMQAYDRGELARKLEESQRENKELKAKNEELNEEKLQKRYTKESNDSLNNMLLGVVKQAPIILKGLGFNIPIEANGLGVASADDIENDTYSEVKKSFLETIKSLDDDTIALLQVIYQKINEKSENNVFSQELFELLQQNQMLV